MRRPFAFVRPAISLALPAFSFASVGAPEASAPAEKRAETERLDLAAFVKAAEEQGHQLGEARARLVYAEARADMADAKRWFSGTLDTIVAPLPGVSGGESPLTARTDWSSWGAFWTTRLEVIQPIYTFGAIDGGRRAARAGLEAEKKLFERDRWQLRTEVHEFYFGYQLAFELAEIARDVVGKLEGALEATKGRKLSAGDRDRLEDFLAEARARLAEADKTLAQIRAGMAWKIGVYGQQTPRWDRANLRAREVKLPSLETLQAGARETRPELAALAREVEAKRGLAEVERGLSRPTLFVAGRLNYGVAPGRPDYASPYVQDPFNELSGGVGVGLRWNVGFLESSAKSRMAQAEALQAEAKSKHLGPAILAEIEKNYRDVEEAATARSIRDRAGESVRRRYQDALAGYGVGAESAKTLLETMGTYAMAEKARLEAIFQYNLRLAKLEQSLGSEFTPER